MVSEEMFENVDGRTPDAGVTGILIAHLRAFGSDELKMQREQTKTALRVRLIIKHINDFSPPQF